MSDTCKLGVTSYVRDTSIAEERGLNSARGHQSKSRLTMGTGNESST